MDRTTKAFILIAAVVVLGSLSVAFPILLYVLVAFVVGTFVGGGTTFYTEKIVPTLFKQFRKPQKTKTPRARKGKGT